METMGQNGNGDSNNTFNSNVAVDRKPRGTKIRGRRFVGWVTAAVAVGALVFGGTAFGADRGKHGDRDRHGADRHHRPTEPIRRGHGHSKSHDKHAHNGHSQDRHRGHGHKGHGSDHHRGHSSHGSKSGVTFHFGNDKVGFGIRIGDSHRSRGHHSYRHHGHHGHHGKRWVPGHYETRKTQVLVRAAHYDHVYVPPVFQNRCDRWGRTIRVKVRDGYYKKVYHPAKYETRYTKVWVPGCWQTVHHGHHGRYH